MTDRRIDREHKAADGRFEVRFTRQDDLLFSTVIGTLSSEEADVLIDLYRDWQTQIGKPYRHIMDVSQLAGEEPEARKKMHRVTGGTDSPFARFAIHGGNFAQRAMFNMYGLVSKVPMKMFSSEEAALAWIMED